MQTDSGAAESREVRFTLVNRISEIDRLHQEIKSAEVRLGLPEEVGLACVLALEEIVINIINYGYDDEAEHLIEIRLEVLSAGEIRLTVQDDGRSFNPLLSHEPDTNSPLEERPVGGLGIHIVKKMMDNVRYEHRGDRNILTLVRYAR